MFPHASSLHYVSISYFSKVRWSVISFYLYFRVSRHCIQSLFPYVSSFHHVSISYVSNVGESVISFYLYFLMSRHPSRLHFIRLKRHLKCHFILSLNYSVLSFHYLSTSYVSKVSWKVFPASQVESPSNWLSRRMKWKVFPTDFRDGCIE